MGRQLLSPGTLLFNQVSARQKGIQGSEAEINLRLERCPGRLGGNWEIISLKIYSFLL